MVKKMGLASQVSFVGFQQEMEPIYLQADILLCTTKYEGFPLAILEAQAAGLPVVMYELPYLTLVEGRPGILAVEQGAQDDAADAITRLFKDDILYACLPQKGMANAEKIAPIDQSEQWRIMFTQIERPHPRLNEATSDANTIYRLIRGHGVDIRIAQEACDILGISFKEGVETTNPVHQLAGKTINHHHRLISSILNQAVFWQVIPDNPSRRVKPPKFESKEAKYLDEEQTAALLRLLDNEPYQNQG